MEEVVICDIDLLDAEKCKCNSSIKRTSSI